MPASEPGSIFDDPGAIEEIIDRGDDDYDDDDVFIEDEWRDFEDAREEWGDDEYGRDDEQTSEEG